MNWASTRVARFTRMKKSGLMATAMALAITPAVPAYAQQASSATDTGGLEDIVVTAQKRSESLQRTPLAISAVSADTLETRRITDVISLSAVAPSLTTTASSGKNNVILKIRGIGESDVQMTNDAPIGLYIDGVIVGRAAAGAFEIVDLERVEVLRGPQGTLYGRNTTGGAVNLITKKPSDTFGAELVGSYGRWNYFQSRASVDTGELGDSGFKAKISYLHKQRDGFYDNLTTPDRRDPGSYNIDAFRTTLAYDRGGAVRGHYSFDYTHMNSTANPNQLTVASANVLAYLSNSVALGGAALHGPSPRLMKKARSHANLTTDEVMGHNLTLEMDLSSDLTLRSISGFRRMETDLVQGDGDAQSGLLGLVISPGLPSVREVRLFDGDIYRRQHQFSQEINLIGSIGSRLNYVLGAYYFTEKGKEVNPQYLTVVRPLGGGQFGGINAGTNLVYNSKSTSKALFGEANYELADGLNFIGGLRYTRDDKEAVQTSPIARSLKGNWDKFTWSATLQYQASPDVMTYARVATGYKAGGFNIRANNNGYEPEFVTNYEVGVKSELFDRRLRFNGTLFYMLLKDKQLNQLQAGATGLTTITVNAGEAEYKGVEVEIEAIPVDGLRLNAAVGYTDPKFKTFMYFDAANNKFTNIGNRAKFTYSSKLTLNTGAEYSFGSFAGGVLSARLDYAYRSSTRFNVIPFASPYDEDIKAKGYGLLDARLMLADLTVGAADATITLWGRNITNKSYRTQGIDFGSLGFAVSTYGEPASYGVDVKFKF